ncbi:MAG: isopentenyl-diphosphate Delta-isomerase [Bacteroidetes bacterium]|nr:isopentenyl-diphosphate Delta-isomerase [Bacteroidota bacterium]
MSEQKVVLVDRKDNTIGTIEKIEAHVTGSLHRAFSVFIFNSKGELMIQQRALSKYHSPGLWTNTCCSHPKLNEGIKESAFQRLKEEMGIECSLNSAFTFIYKSEVGQGLIEHEFDHVFVGTYDEAPLINTDEVCDWKFVKMELLRDDIDNHPDNYTEWFKIVFEKVENYLRENSL